MRLVNSLNFNNLYYFHVIARAGSLANAVKVLNVSQPTLSQQLKYLEEQLGIELFDRKGRSLKLNSIGKSVYDYTSRIFSISESMMKNIAYQKKSEVKLTYRIGLSPSVSRNFSALLLKPILNNRKVGMSINEANYKELIDKLRSRKIDFFLGNSLPSEHKANDIEIVKIRKLKYVFVANKAMKEKLTDIPKDLDKVPYFKYTNYNSVQQELDALYFDHGILPSVIGESEDLRIQIQSAVFGDCFSVVPEVSVQDELENEKLYKIDEFLPESAEICAFFLKNNSNQEVSALVDTIKENF